MSKEVKSTIATQVNDYPEVDTIAIDCYFDALPAERASQFDLLDSFIHKILNDSRITGKFNLINKDDLPNQALENKETRYPILYAINEMGLIVLKILLMFRNSNSILNTDCRTYVTIDYSYGKSIKSFPDDYVYHTYDEAIQMIPVILSNLWNEYSSNAVSSYYHGYDISLIQHFMFRVHDHANRHPENSKDFKISNLKEGESFKSVLKEIKEYIDSNSLENDSVASDPCLRNEDLQRFVTEVMRKIRNHFFYINKLKYCCVEACAELSSNSIHLLIIDSDQSYYSGKLTVDDFSEIKNNLQYYINRISEDVIRCFQETYDFISWSMNGTTVDNISKRQSTNNQGAENAYF